MNDKCCQGSGCRKHEPDIKEEVSRKEVEAAVGKEPERERFTQTEELTKLIEAMTPTQPKGTGAVNLSFVLLKHLRRISERIDLAMADVRAVNTKDDGDECNLNSDYKDSLDGIENPRDFSEESTSE